MGVCGACGWVVNVAVPTMGVVSHCGAGVAVPVLLSSPWASVLPLTTIVGNGEILIIPCGGINTGVCTCINLIDFNNNNNNNNNTLFI